MNDHGANLQRLLESKLKAVTPYVRSEPSTARFDMVAYILPPKRREKNNLCVIGTQDESFDPRYPPCGARMKRCYCNAKWREMMSRVTSERRRSDPLRRYSEETFYQLDGKEYKAETGIWASRKSDCKCESEGCDTLTKNLEARKACGGLNEVLQSGLHCFEVKSDYDVDDRLVHQIPQMLHLADYVWLVVGKEKTVPAWLPPYIGILRHDGAEGFHIERAFCFGTVKTPAKYKQVFESCGCTETQARTIAHIFHQEQELHKAWAVNAMFHFQNQEAMPANLEKYVVSVFELAGKIKTKQSKTEVHALVREHLEYQSSLGEAGTSI